MADDAGIKVGDALWMKDNRDSRQGWKSKVITGETKLSWIVGDETWNQSKVLKATMRENLGKWGHQRWFTAEGMHDSIWIAEHRRSIASAVEGTTDIALLKQVAAVIGWEPKSK